MKKKKKEIKKDVEVTRLERMKGLCLSNDFSCFGEILHLLDGKVLPRLVEKISEDNVKLSSNFVYGTDTISSELKFLENLNNYIGFVRDHYFIPHVEQLMLIELSLENKYSAILFSPDDFYYKDNSEIFHKAFIRMFFWNFWDNIHYFSDKVEHNSSIIKFLKDVEEYNFDVDDNDIYMIEEQLIEIIEFRGSNFISSFTPHSSITSQEDFYIHQLEWILDDYYGEISGSCSTVPTPKKKPKKKRWLTAIFTVIFVALVIACIWVHNNKLYTYEIAGESQNFLIKDWVFVKGQGRYMLLVNDPYILSGEIEEEDITNVRLSCKDRLIVAASDPISSPIEEHIGYDEYFPDEVVNNMNNWTYEISYKAGDDIKTETIRLYSRSLD